MATAMAMKLLLTLLVLLASTDLSFSLYEDQVGLMDWHQQYVGKLKHAVFHSQKTSRKRVVVSTHENVLASIGLRHGEIFWRHALGTNDAIDELVIWLGKYVITLSSNGTLLRAWNLPDGQLAWESFLRGTKPSKSILHVPASMKVEKENVILIYSNGFLHAVSGIDGEVLWRKDLVSDSVEVQHIFQSPQGDFVYAFGLVGSTKFSLLQVDAKNGELLKHNNEEFPNGFFGEILSLSSNLFVILDGSRSNIVTINLQHGEVSYQQTPISTVVKSSSGKAELLPSKLAGMFAMKLGSSTIVIKVIDGARLEVVGRLENVAAVSDALSISDDHHAIAIVQHGDGEIQLTVKHGHDWGNDLLKESIVIDHTRGNVEKVFINNYIRTDRSLGFRTLISMEDHSLLLVQQGAIVWSREDGLASVVDVTTSELPFKKHGVPVVKVEQNLFEWLNGHLLKLKGTLMLAGPDDVAAIQAMTLRSSGKSKMTRDHNGFRKLLIVLTKAGKVFALHTGDGHIVWSVLLQSTRKSDTCMNPTAVNIYQWQIPHHHAMDENPSVLVVGRCGPSLAAPAALSFVDTFTGMEFKSVDLVHSIAQVIPLPYTDSTEQRLHLLVDINQKAYLYPKTQEALGILKVELPNVYWYSVEADNGIIKGHALKSNCFHEAMDEYCFEFRHLWSIVFPSESEKIITTVARKSSEVVHTQAKVTSDQDVMYKYISKNLLFVATVSPKAVGEIGTATPEEASLVVYIIDTVTGRILHRMIHHGCKGPVHAVFSENWVVYHYFNVRAHRFEMSVLEIYDQSRAESKEVWKLVLGKHNLTSPISLYSRPEIITKSQTYFFTHSVKAIAVTSTAKGITSKQLLIGTIGDQVLALDKRYLDPRRSLNPSQAEKEEGIIPLTDSLPIIPQSYVTHSRKVEGLRGILTVPAKLESTTLVFAYGVDLFFTRLAPSRTYDSLTEDFSYALLLITIAALIAAIFATWILSERKELQDKWR